MSEHTASPQEERELLLEQELQEPPLFQVVLHNDHYTTMEFVVRILVEVFHKDVEAATAIMLAVHKNGTGVCGVYTHEIAETKVQEVLRRARQAQFPLRCTLETVR